MSSNQHFKQCVPSFSHYITGGLCVVCMGAEGEWSALEGAEHAQCERLPLRMLHFQLTLFEEGAQAHGPHSTGPAFAEAERWLRLWRMQMDLTEGTEMGTAFSLPSPGRSSAFTQVSEAHSAVSSAQVWFLSTLIQRNPAHSGRPQTGSDKGTKSQTLFREGDHIQCSSSSERESGSVFHSSKK